MRAFSTESCQVYDRSVLVPFEVWETQHISPVRMETTEVRAPQLWRRPHAKIYSYNQDFSANYYSVDTGPVTDASSH